jgi:hypothetical protein
MAVTKCDPRKAAGVEGVPGEIVRIVAGQRSGRLLDLFNSINWSGRIAAVWKVARVVLLPKSTRDPLSSSSYRPISVLPALSNVWEHTCEILIERCLGGGGFHRIQKAQEHVGRAG